MGGGTLRCNGMMLGRAVGELVPCVVPDVFRHPGVPHAKRPLGSRTGGPRTKSGVTEPTGYASRKPMPMLARALSASLLTTG